MKHYIILYCYIVIPICVCSAQTTDIWEEKAESLSNMADFYFTSKNYDKAIECELLSYVPLYAVILVGHSANSSPIVYFAQLLVLVL